MHDYLSVLVAHLSGIRWSAPFPSPELVYEVLTVLKLIFMYDCCRGCLTAFTILMHADCRFISLLSLPVTLDWTGLLANKAEGGQEGPTWQCLALSLWHGYSMPNWVLMNAFRESDQNQRRSKSQYAPFITVWKRSSLLEHVCHVLDIMDTVL